MTREEKIQSIINDTDKNYSPYYNFLPKLIKERKYKRGIEIGVFAGGHVKSILDKTILDLLIGVDPYMMYSPGMPGLDSQEDYDCLMELTNNRLGSDRYMHLRMTSDDAFQLLKAYTSYDFVFIDGVHTYDQVKKDLESYSKIIKKGGVVACHDYHHPSFKGVTVAIDEFAKVHNLRIVQCPLHAVYMEWR